jgi:uncharacterized membrane protein
MPESQHSPTPLAKQPRVEQQVQAPAQVATSRQLAGVVVFVVAYAALSQYSNSVPDARGLATSLSIAPLLLVGAILVWRGLHKVVALSIFALAATLLILYWTLLTEYYEWNDVVQQCGVYAAASIGFGRSLFGGRVPLCTQLSLRLHGPLTTAEIAYTRKATVALTLFYGLLAPAILVLFFVTSLRVWSLFTNFAVFGLIGLMFAADHAIRRRLLPHRPGGILAALRQSLTGSR